VQHGHEHDQGDRDKRAQTGQDLGSAQQRHGGCGEREDGCSDRHAEGDPDRVRRSKRKPVDSDERAADRDSRLIAQ